MTNRKEIITLIKDSNGNWETKIIEDFENDCKKAGIWALKGKKENEENYHYLEFAETKCIKKEIKKDIALIRKHYDIEDIKKRIIKRQKPVFSWSEPIEETSLPRLKEKYREISEKYKFLCFELLEFEKDEKKRREKEAEYAVDQENQALYWRPIKDQWYLKCVKDVPKWDSKSLRQKTP